MPETEQSAPLSVATLSGPEGQEPTYAVLGNTYDAKLILAAHGGKYDQNRKFWTFASLPDAQKATSEACAYYAMRAARRGASA